MLDHNGQTLEKGYDVFISHATEDKDFVRDLAEILRGSGVKVWYDEYELKVGDSLRQKIDDGLARSKFGAVVLSPSFFQKNWTQYELDGLTARQMSGERVILPIWYRLTKDELLKYAPSLADIVALNSSIQTREEIAAEIANKVNGGTSLSGNMSLGSAISMQVSNSTLISSEDIKRKLDEWATEQRESARIIPSDSKYGYVESAHTLIRAEDQIWTPQEILKTAESAKGIYRDKFRPTQDGIELRVEADDLALPRYWKLDRSGKSYSCELLTEDFEQPRITSSRGHLEKTLWLDLAVGRIARLLRDSARIYEELGISSGEPYLLSIKHNRIGGRTLYSTEYIYYAFRDKISQEDSHTWQEEVTQDRINNQLVELMHEIANPLFFLFDFSEVYEDMVEKILGRQGSSGI